jgi:hypothetical protein
MLPIGRVIVRSTDKPALVSDIFKPKVDVSIGELTDVDISDLENGHSLIFNSSENKFISKRAEDLTGQITQLFGGTF